MQGFRDMGHYWKEVVVTDLRHLSAHDKMHFNEIKRLLGISSNLLAKNLNS
jgi:DNA-binding HxlR family transcriptional regulator